MFFQIQGVSIAAGEGFARYLRGQGIEYIGNYELMLYRKALLQVR
jgi:hypothetical protein